MTDLRCKILLRSLFNGKMEDINLLTCSKLKLEEAMKHLVLCYYEYVDNSQNKENV